jgi:hypothetical protein
MADVQAASNNLKRTGLTFHEDHDDDVVLMALKPDNEDGKSLSSSI